MSKRSGSNQTDPNRKPETEKAAKGRQDRGDGGKKNLSPLACSLAHTINVKNSS